MYHQTKGIVISNTKYGETSIVCKVYTENFGLQTYIINGVRKKKGKSIYYQPLSLLDLTVYHKEKSTLQRVKEAKPFYQYQSLPYAIEKSSIAFFMAEVLQKCLREEEENIPLFNFIWQSLIALDTQELDSQFHLHFLLQLSSFLGFYPNTIDGNEGYFDMINGTFVNSIPTHKHYFEDTEPLLTLLNGHSVLKKNKRFLLEKLIEYYRLHIEGFSNLKTLPVLETIFN
jgi:DNA repair protein RecO (recombination protein O)